MKRNEVLEEPPVEVVPPDIDNQALDQALNEIEKEQAIGGEEEVKPETKYPRPLPPAPVVQFEEPPEPPSEPSGVGVNKMVFYVCNEAGDPWIELPDVTPKQIRVARKIIKSFTGNLDQEIVTYPEFPGTERNYLRAQLARISAGKCTNLIEYI